MPATIATKPAWDWRNAPFVDPSWPGRCGARRPPAGGGTSTSPSRARPRRAQAGELLAAKGLDFDLCFTSVQTRAIHTLHIASGNGPAVAAGEKDWRLNERHMAGSTGSTRPRRRPGRRRAGACLAAVVRHAAAALAARSPYDLGGDRRYAGVPVPVTESLKDTIARVLPYWEARIAPALREGQGVLISAHGNSLRALVKHLSNIPDGEITGLEIPGSRRLRARRRAERGRTLLSEGSITPLPLQGEAGEFLYPLEVQGAARGRGVVARQGGGDADRRLDAGLRAADRVAGRRRTGRSPRRVDRGSGSRWSRRAKPPPAPARRRWCGSGPLAAGRHGRARVAGDAAVALVDCLRPLRSMLINAPACRDVWPG